MPLRTLAVQRTRDLTQRLKEQKEEITYKPVSTDDYFDDEWRDTRGQHKRPDEKFQAIYKDLGHHMAAAVANHTADELLAPN